MAAEKSGYEYDFAVSFAGEDRATAEQFAALVKAAGFNVFYDAWEMADLWGRDLYQHLNDIYSKRARFCVIFISKAYAAKAWTKHEIRSAQERALQESEAYILPVRLDDTTIPGITKTTGYLDARHLGVKKIAENAIEKITKVKSAKADAPVKVSASKPVSPPRASKVQIKKQFTELERDVFVTDAFERIAKFFESSLLGLAAQHEGIVGRFRQLTANHFTAFVYRNGKSVSKCGIRMSVTHSGSEIVYSDNPESTNTMNDAVCVQDDGQSLFLKSRGYFAIFGGQGKGENKMTPEEAAEQFWEKLLEPLQR